MQTGDAKDRLIAELREKIARLEAPKPRVRQPVYYHSRWGHCAKCGHTALYAVHSKRSKGLRLRDTPCRQCRRVLGRGANKRAQRTKWLANLR